MTCSDQAHLARLQFYTPAPYGCSYLPNRIARSQIAAPNHLIDPKTYGELIHAGFRRSGTFTYRPHCDHCQACIAVRLPVARYQPNRSQRRALAQHSPLIASVELKRRGDVRRAKLYYLRNLTGKKARIREKLN